MYIPDDFSCRAGMGVTTRETCRPGLVPPLPRPPVGGHWPATVRPGVPPPTPPPTQRTTCLPRASLGGHGRATGGGGVRNSNRTCGNVYGGGAALVVK